MHFKPPFGLLEMAGRYGKWLSSPAGTQEPVVLPPVSPRRDAVGLAGYCLLLEHRGVQIATAAPVKPPSLRIFLLLKLKLGFNFIP